MEMSGDTADDLLELCRNDPTGGLEALARLPRQERDQSICALAKMTALRERVFRSLSDGQISLFDVDDLELARRSTEHTAQYTGEAFHEAQFLITQEDIPDETAALVDDILFLQERLSPGSLQPILGWTKLKYLGAARIGSACQSSPPPSAMHNILDVKVRAPEPIRSAILSSAIAGGDGDWEATFLVLKTDFTKEGSIGIGSVAIDEKGHAKFTSNYGQSIADTTSPLLETPSSAPEIGGLRSPSADPIHQTGALGHQVGRPPIILGAAIALVAVAAFGILFFGGHWPSATSTQPLPSDAIVSQYVTRPAIVRNSPTTVGSQQITMLDRGTQLQGTWVTGGSAAAHWLRIAVGPYAGDFVSGVNLSANQRPNVVRAINSEVTVLQRADMLAFPAAVDSILVSVEPGTSVQAAAEVDGGWIEVQRKLGGVGYLPAGAFENQQQGAVVIIPAPTSAGFQPSFDCARATKWAELQVCNTATLAEQDRHIADDYVVLMRAASGLERASLRSAQRSWIILRDQCESHGGLVCLDQVYSARLSALNAQISSVSGAAIQSSVRPPEPIPPTTTITTFECVKNDNANVHATFIVDYANHTVRSPNFGAIGQNLSARISDSTIAWHAREVRNYGFGGFIDQDMSIDKVTGALTDNYGDGVSYFSCRSE